jgi:hypothetical protein
MKTILKSALLIALVAMSLSTATFGQKEKLFNGKNLKNWTFQLREPGVDPSTVFKVTDGVISVSGQPFGYMRTKKSYADYRLHVEWRYPVEASNSGVFVHGQLPDTIWLKCFECQLKSGSAGDFVLMNGSEMAEKKDKNMRIIPKKEASSEKPVGEWNTMEVTCLGNSIEVFVNGILQNKGTSVSPSSGFICLQSEGKTIEFRNVFLTKLK